jgi:hypothetical protein
MELLWQLIGTLLLVGFLIKYWWLVAMVLAADAVWNFGPGRRRRYEASVTTPRRDGRPRRPAARLGLAGNEHSSTVSPRPKRSDSGAARQNQLLPRPAILRFPRSRAH